MVVVGFIEPPNDRTVVTLDATSDVYVVVYTWNSDSGETIFDGQAKMVRYPSVVHWSYLSVSQELVSVSKLQCSILAVAAPPPTQSPPDTTESPPPSPTLTVAGE